MSKLLGDFSEDRIKGDLSTGFSRTQAGTGGAPIGSVTGASASTVIGGKVRRVWTFGDPIDNSEAARGFYLKRT